MMVKVAEIRLGEISQDRFRRYFGYDESNPPSERTIALIDEESRWLLDNAEPRGLYAAFPCELVDKRTVRIGPREFRSIVLRMHLEGSRAAAILAVTMGDAIDERISGLMDAGEMARGYILNGLASAAADCAADALEAIIREDIAAAVPDTAAGGSSGNFIDPGWKMTLRFSPGYADFILENQRGIFELIGPERIGLSLNPSCLMKPLKSITAVIGIGPDVNTDGYPCELCDVCNITTCKYFDGL
jgi:hypothetical protein